MELTIFLISIAIFLFSIFFWILLYCNWKKDRIIGNIIQLFFTAIIIVLFIADVYLKISLQRSCIIDTVYLIGWIALFLAQCYHIKNCNYRIVTLIDGNNRKKIKLRLDK